MSDAFFISPTTGIVHRSKLSLRRTDRCNQEKLIEQQKNGVHAFTAPLDNLNSNWAYMVIASLAWSLKAWSALLASRHGRWQEKHTREKQQLLRMDFATYRNAVINIPAQIVRTGRKIVYRMLAWNPWQACSFACSIISKGRHW